MSDLCATSPYCRGREKQTDREKVKGFTCFSKSAPYQALHDRLLHEPPGFPVGTKKEGKKEMNCMLNGQRCIQNCPELESGVCDYHFEGRRVC